jgi:two-component system phosphate regulon response regulator PhoB
MKKILVVDDQPVIRMMMRLVLEEQFTVIETENVDNALSYIHVDRPDAILLDVMMPGTMNGFQLCELIKQDVDHSSIRIVLVTACSQVEDQELGRAVGADAYFIKPFSPMAIRQYLVDTL